MLQGSRFDVLSVDPGRPIVLVAEKNAVNTASVEIDAWELIWC